MVDEGLNLKCDRTTVLKSEDRMGYVQIGRFLDGAVLGLFLMCFSGASLFMFGELYTLITQLAKTAESKPLGILEKVLKNIFPFKHTRFEFTLTHVLLFAVVMCLLCTRPDVEAYPEVYEKKVLTLKRDNQRNKSGRSSERTHEAKDD